MRVILSIKPEFSEAILSGRKRYEFRKRGFGNPDSITMVYMYATTPVQKVVGAFSIREVIEDHPCTLWRRFASQAGIDKARFFEYFGSREKGVAIAVDKVTRFRPVDPWEVSKEFHPPQSFAYVDDSLWSIIPH